MLDLGARLQSSPSRWSLGRPRGGSPSLKLSPSAERFLPRNCNVSRSPNFVSSGEWRRGFMLIRDGMDGFPSPIAPGGSWVFWSSPRLGPGPRPCPVSPAPAGLLCTGDGNWPVPLKSYCPWSASKGPFGGVPPRNRESSTLDIGSPGWLCERGSLESP